MTFTPFRSLMAAAACVTLFAGAQAQAQLITNSPQPITHQVFINPIIVSNDDGSNTAEYFGTPTQETAIKDFVDDIWAQAGIDIVWQSTKTWDDTFANVGSGGARPTSDLSQIVSDATAEGGLIDANPNTINMFFVEIAAGFSDTSENTANGLAFVGGNGITQHVGDNLPGFNAGREVIASVVAHEIGHNLGLPHIVEAENLMQAGGSPNQGERLNQSQINTALASNLSVEVPEPATLPILAAGLLIAARRRRRAA